jgi:hypothetical protein
VGQRLQVDAAPPLASAQARSAAGSPLAAAATVNTGTGNASRQGAP